MEPQIRPVGPIPARIMLIGEAPGEVEVREGKPFVGPSGRILDSMLNEAGIVREQCYITNVVLRRPDGNDFNEFYVDKGRREPNEELVLAWERLADEIRRVNPNVIVPLGEEAMRAITGKRGITHWRGSILETRITRGTATATNAERGGPSSLVGSNESTLNDMERYYKCVPTIHPAAIIREWDYRPAAVCDLIRARSESARAECQIERRDYVVIRTISAFTENWPIIKGAKNVAFDIETETGQITSIAFAPDNRANWAICIPFWFGASGSLWTPEEEGILWAAIRDVLTDNGIGKIAHNGAYDIEFIQRTVGFDVGPFYFDTMLGFHTMYMELPKGLDFVNSIYTDHPYYKYQRKTISMDEYFKYNATDACLTMEIAHKLIAELKEEGLWEFYNNYVHALSAPLLAMQRMGVKFDFLRRNTLKKRFQEEIAVLQKKLDALVGHPINTNSPKQMKEWLYGPKTEGNLGLKIKTKKRKTTGEETVAADEEAIEALYQESKLEALRVVLKIREKQKILSTYLEVTLDDDKRIRCSYLITGTETGRLSSRTTARGTGTNLQNVPPGIIRSLFLPDDGKVFINADLSQAEARVVAYLSNESRLIRVFDEGGDIHRKNAANIFGIPESNVSDEQRQLAKRVVHASNYGMGPITFSRTAGISSPEAKRLLNQYFATYPGIANWHHAVGAQLRAKRYLVNPFGRKRTFFGRYGEQLVREGLAYLPQSTVADVLNQGLIELYKSRAWVEGVDILLQVHDSVLIQAPEGKVGEAMQMLKDCLTRPIDINGKILQIPVDIKIGPNWDDLKKHVG